VKAKRTPRLRVSARSPPRRSAFNAAAKQSRAALVAERLPRSTGIGALGAAGGPAPAGGALPEALAPRMAALTASMSARGPCRRCPRPSKRLDATFTRCGANAVRSLGQGMAGPGWASDCKRLASVRDGEATSTTPGRGRLS
jgi:hypothetical protein